MERNESLLIAASYFLSDMLNAFVFGHGPASPTLADVLMLTGLDISTTDNSHLFDTKPSSKVETRYWRSLSIKFNYQINKEKDPNEINI